jgi:hypothetical protein
MNTNVNKHTQLTTYGAYIEATDTQLVKTFSVPTQWLTRIVAEEFDQTLENFLDSYIWDTSEIVLNLATPTGLVKIVEV